MKYLVVVAAFWAVTFSPASAKTMACKKDGLCTYYMSVQRIQTNAIQRIQTNAVQRTQTNVRDPFENMHFE